MFPFLHFGQFYRAVGNAADGVSVIFLIGLGLQSFQIAQVPFIGALDIVFCRGPVASIPVHSGVVVVEFSCGHGRESVGVVAWVVPTFDSPHIDFVVEIGFVVPVDVDVVVKFLPFPVFGYVESLGAYAPVGVFYLVSARFPKHAVRVIHGRCKGIQIAGFLAVVLLVALDVVSELQFRVVVA